eukprot:PhF_6_TR44247/c1_g1_i3/m.68066/K20032/ZDHHC13_17, HIP14; palmitoyltransferase ZDHHC13/17
MISRAGKVETPLRLAYYYDMEGDNGGTELYPSTIDGLTPFEACRESNLPVVAAYVYGGFPLDARERSKGEGTLLHNAALAGDVNLISFLVDVGADVNAQNGIADTMKESTDGSHVFGQTPLFWAASKGHVDAVLTLLNYGAKPDAVDRAGHLAAHGAIKFPLLLHVMHSRGVNVATSLDETKRTVLHDAAHEGQKYAILYMIEVAKVDVNVKDCAGNTPLHFAAKRNDIIALRVLLHKGANPDTPNVVGLTPRDVASVKCKQFFTQYDQVQTNAVLKEKMLISEPTNFEYLKDHPKMLGPACISLIVPNLIVVIATWFHAFFGLLSVFSLGIMMVISAKFQSSSRRSLITPGWFAGALLTGSYLLWTEIFPDFRQTSDTAPLLVYFWVVVTGAMFYCYLRSVFADPGIIHSTTSMREEMYHVVAKGMQLDKHDFCGTCMIRKPHRSKHCSVTGHCVYRFDHYCVWTGNAVGAGSHRFFMAFLILQTFSQVIVAYSTFLVSFTVRPYSGAQPPPSGLVNWLTFLVHPSNALITYFLLFYNTLIFMFMFTVLVTQVNNTGKNQTSNEAWFSNRYRWMFPIGTKVYSLYDQGSFTANWKEFWFGNLKAEHFTIPDMPPFLQELTRQYFAKNGGGGGGHTHDGRPCHGHHHGHHDDHNNNNHSSVVNMAPPGPPQDFQSAVLAAQNALPPEKARELKVMQHVLLQITQGKEKIDIPEDLVTSPEERDRFMQQVETLRERHRQVMAQFNTTTTSSVTTATTAITPAASVGLHGGVGGGGGSTKHD